MSRPLHIRAAGMVTAVGLDAPSSCAALRARIDGFRETRFVGPSGDWLIGAAVPLPRNWIGQKRMAHLAAGAIAEVCAAVPGAEAEAALILCLAEEGRPGRPVRTPTPSRANWPPSSSFRPASRRMSSPTAAPRASSRSTARGGCWPKGRRGTW
jgi:hypothetical protein